MHPKITLYTDGSFRGKLRTGGYAALLTDRYGRFMLVADGSFSTTISRMELTAVIAGLAYVKDGCDVQVVSDSQYAVNVINKWLKLWAETDFVRSNGEQVANLDLMFQLNWQMARMHRVKAIHIDSHTGNIDQHSLGNDICDYYAVRSAIYADEHPPVFC